MKAWRTAMRVAATTAALLVVFAVLGALMMPRWRSEPYTDHIAVASADTAIAANPAAMPASSPSADPAPSSFLADHQGTYRTRERRISVHLEDGGSVPAILREPIGAPGRRPACLFVHGSGTGAADDFGDIANAMSSAGIITLVPAKRTDDYTPLHRDYPRFARDYGTALDLLKLVPGVDTGRTGLYAESEGTWISMLMTEHRHDIAFSILSSAPVYKGREQMAMAVSAYVHQSGAPGPVVKDVAKLMSLDFAPFDLRYADFDADDARDSLTMPVLVNYGTYDTAMPIEQGARTIIDTAARRGNRNVTVRYYAANHQMRAGKGLFAPGLPLADGYTRDLSDWVNGVAAGTGAEGWSTPLIAGAAPDQRYAAPTDTSSGIIGSLGVLAGLTAAALACFAAVVCGAVCFGCAELARRRRIAAMTGSPGRIRARLPIVNRRLRARTDTTGAWPGTSRAFVRDVGYSRGLARLMACGVAVSCMMLVALAAYLSYVGVSALYLRRSPAMMSAGFTVLRVGGVLCMILCAALIVRLAGAWRVRRAYLAHGLYPTAGLHSTWLVGRWHWMVALLALAGMLLALVVMAFWGLFSL
ncbi:alpha/beta hydrolase family protein [Bifidobacterium platyrrhinorum]|uniref:Alpha/beta hydrolase n=1 Tax=Bifidobacterium platyrrhinorum TaxID=2661628 RepID=A0A6L9STP8_9BIFI|nr:alpha/beta hydrolase [Bifidobacterium platyrrhinorum]NEG55977.1 alpha/beta hydrolase [Bifidobacterium platyrrhinorum]